VTTHPRSGPDFVWFIAVVRDIALIAFCIVYILNTV
jgi:hypothetical protein